MSSLNRRAAPCDVPGRHEPSVTTVGGGAPSAARRTPVESRGFADPPRDEGARVERTALGVRDPSTGSRDRLSRFNECWSVETPCLLHSSWRRSFLSIRLATVITCRPQPQADVADTWPPPSAHPIGTRGPHAGPEPERRSPHARSVPSNAAAPRPRLAHRSRAPACFGGSGSLVRSSSSVQAGGVHRQHDGFRARPRGSCVRMRPQSADLSRSARASGAAWHQRREGRRREHWSHGQTGSRRPGRDDRPDGSHRPCRMGGIDRIDRSDRPAGAAGHAR
jgi:hypothetical protein